MADSDETMPVHPDDESAIAAMAIMREWQWGYYDPDGDRVSDSMSLSRLLNRLAIEGQQTPKQDILALLCNGELRARGDYRWNKFVGGDHYQLSGTAADVPRARWRVLVHLMNDSRRRLANLDTPVPKVELPMLQAGECPAFHWDDFDGEFSTVTKARDASTFALDYFEETYSVTNLEIYLPTEYSDLDDLDPKPREHAVANDDRGGRPPAANWELAALELSGRYYKGDFKPATKADVQRELAAYLAESDIHPSASTLANHAKPIFEAFQAWERD